MLSCFTWRIRLTGNTCLTSSKLLSPRTYTYYYVAHEARHWRQAWTATARRRYKRSSHGRSTARADSRLSPCVRTRMYTVHTRKYSSSRVLSFFSSHRSAGRRSGRGPLWVRYTSHDVVRRVRRGSVGRGWDLMPFSFSLLITRVPLLSFFSPFARFAHLSALATRIVLLSRSDPLLWQPLNWLFGVCICR